MKTNLHTFSASLLALSLISPLTSQAGEWGVGVNLNNRYDVYVDHDDDLNLNIAPEYRSERFNLDFESMSYRLFYSDKYNLEILAKAVELGFEKGDSKTFAGMMDRDPSINAGLRASYTTDYGLFSLHALTDVLGKHKGQEVELRFGEPFYTRHSADNKKELTLGSFVGTRWQSDDLIDYYYGVKNNEATATRKAFKGTSAITPFVGVELKLGLSESFGLEGALRYEHRPDKITQSDIASKNGMKARLGLTYWF